MGRVEVTLEPQPAGNVGAEVVLTVASEGKTRTVTIPVLANVSAPVTVSPARLALPLASGTGPLFTGSCLVRCLRNAPIRVQPSELPADCTAEVADPELAAPTKLVRVKWTPPQAAGAGEAYPQSRTLAFDVWEGAVKHHVTLQVDCSNPR